MSGDTETMPEPSRVSSRQAGRVSPRPAAVAWARHVAECYGNRDASGRYVVRHSQAELLRLDGYRDNDGRISRYLTELGGLVERNGRDLVIDLDRLMPTGRAPARLRALPSSANQDQATCASVPDVAGLGRRVAELEELLKAKDHLIDSLLAERALLDQTSSRADSRGSSSDRANPREFPREVRRESSSPEIASELLLSHSARSRGTPRDRADEGEVLLNWVDSDLPGLLNDLVRACERHDLAGITSARGLRDALRETGRSRSAVVAAQRKIARQLDAGARLRSPFGLLVQAARESWPEYFPDESEEPPAEIAKPSADDTIDAAEHAVTDLEQTADPYLLELDGLVEQWRASIPEVLRSRVGSMPIDESARRHVDRVEAWRYLKLEQPSIQRQPVRPTQVPTERSEGAPR